MRNIFLFLWLSLLASCVQSYCDGVNSFRNEEHCAVVKKKYRVKWNKNEPILQTKDSCSDLDYFLTLGDKSGLFEYVEVGDSLYKESNSLRVYVYRGGMENSKVFDMDLGCK